MILFSGAVERHGFAVDACIRILVLILCVVSTPLTRAEAPTESPVTRIRADYVCSLGKGAEVVAFTLAAPGASARVWLGLADSDMGLEPEVRTFTYGACAGCFELHARYRFSGGPNLLQLETVAEGLDFPAGEWPPRPPAPELNPDQEGPIEPPAPPEEGLWRRPFWARALEIDCDLPPGMELPPECREDDDRPPGSDPLPKDPTPTPTPEEPVTPVGPPLKIRYFETSLDGGRLLFQSTGTCVPR